MLAYIAPHSTSARGRDRTSRRVANTNPNGRIIIGLPLATDDQQAMIGSVYLMEAADRAAAETFADGDPYARWVMPRLPALLLLQRNRWKR